jgi:Tol biopolymer transport system component
MAPGRVTRGGSPAPVRGFGRPETRRRARERGGHRLCRALTSCAAALLFSCTGSVSSSQSTDPSHGPTESLSPFTGDDAWIAYQTDRSGSGGVWLVHPDGTDDHQIAAGVHDEQQLPNWSPDGSHLVFTTRGGNTEPLFEYDLATDEARQLFACTDQCLGDDEPVYSPDGTEVAFIRILGPLVTGPGGDEVPSDCGLWIGDVTTGEVRQVTSNTDPPCDRELLPRWSPDGRRLTYWRASPSKDGSLVSSVYVMDADGLHRRRLTEPGIFAGEPDWSPDGAWIVFASHPLSVFECCVTSDLFRIHPDGTGLEQLTRLHDESERATQPRYTPDGQWILFTRKTESGLSMWALPTVGGDPVEVLPGGIYTHGTWQPTP